MESKAIRMGYATGTVGPDPSEFGAASGWYSVSEICSLLDVQVSLRGFGRRASTSWKWISGVDG